MITRTAPQWRTTPDWQQQLAQAVRDPDELMALLALPEELREAAHRTAAQFPLRVPRGFVARMEKGNPHDPLLRQVLPIAAEGDAVAGFGTDPVGDLHAMTEKGVIHKYHGRVLLTVTGACAIHCRYCFRRHFPYAEANAGRAQWQGALHYIERQTDISEVILSGGDPLSLADSTLGELVGRLDRIPHLQRLRLHTRQPVVLPERVTAPLLRWLDSTRLQCTVVIHANHANELDTDVQRSLQLLKGHVDALLNQSVLLAGVNDGWEPLSALSERLFECGVLPYYLHLLDPVHGAAHFQVETKRARRIHQQLQASLPGYLVPRLAQEVPGDNAKTLL